MDKGFIDRVHKIVITHITDEKFGVTNLALLIGLSTSQTLRKIKAITGKSVNQYIREVRLTEAAKLIEETDLTAAEIAYKVGFGSPSYFNKTFHRRFGVTPGDYKTQNISLSELASKDAKKEIHNIISKKNVLYFITIVMLLFVGYILINNASFSTIESKEKSIAVLPYTTIGKIEDRLWFGEGLAEVLLDNLSKVEELIVKSRNSSELFKDSLISSNKLGKLLDANYIIEGSIQHFGDSIRVITRLVTAENNQLVWSKINKVDINEMFIMQKNISRQIVSQLNITISSKEEEQLNYYPTKNIEALRLFQRGRDFANLRTPDGVKTSITLYKKAIQLDPNYTDAYGELASSYLLRLWGNKITKEEGEKLIHYYVSKALSINKNCVSAYSTLGNLNLRNGNYEKAEEQFKKAIKINPNDATAHHYYALFHGDKPIRDLEKYLYHIARAYKLDPLSLPISSTYIAGLNLNNKPNEAMEVFNSKKFLFSDWLQTSHLVNINLRLSKDWNAAFLVYENALKNNPNDVKVLLNLARDYRDVRLDAENYLKFSQRVYELNPNRAAYDYFMALMYNENFNRAKALLGNKVFTNNVNDENMDRFNKLTGLFHYFTGDYKRALEYFNKLSDPDESVFQDKSLFHDKCLVLVKLGKQDEAIKYMRDHIKTNEGKALIFAALVKRDSMYHYLEKIDNKWRAKYTNGDIEFNPYRKEERFKAFLKKNYLPITKWNE